MVAPLVIGKSTKAGIMGLGAVRNYLDACDNWGRLEIIWKSIAPLVSLLLYLLMGWTILIAIKPMLAQVPLAGLILLMAGELSYTLGVFFFANDSKLKYGHFIWHLFALAGTACHYFSILWYAA